MGLSKSSFASEEYREDHINRMQNPERWFCPAENWHVLPWVLSEVRLTTAAVSEVTLVLRI